MSERNDGNEGNDDGPHAPAPGQRSIEDIFEAFGDGMGDSRDKVIEEETEEERLDREERERIEALTSSRATHTLNTPERELEIMKKLLQSAKPEDEDGE